MLAAELIFLFIVVGVCTLELCKAAGKDKYKDEYKNKWIEQRKKEEKQIEPEFEGYKFCDDDCYMCGDLEKCKRAVKKEG